jgi:RNA polymerase sigma-B factor
VLQPVEASRDDLVVSHLGLVRAIASRFANRSEPADDLRQAGMIGLLKAADHFDRQRGVAFSSYAYAKIAGEIRRHFRDKCWTIRVPRQTKELNLAIQSLRTNLPATLGRQLSYAEIASRLSVSEKTVHRASELSSMYRPLSLDATLDIGGKPLSVLEVLGNADPDIERAEVRRDISIACATLNDHERLVVRLRFFEDLPQQAIGKIIGKSQMYVSRVEKRAIEKLRRGYYGSTASEQKSRRIAS